MIELGFDPDDLAWHLRCYGEDGLAERVPELTPEQLGRIGHIGGGFATRSDTPSGGTPNPATSPSAAATGLVLYFIGAIIARR